MGNDDDDAEPTVPVASNWLLAILVIVLVVQVLGKYVVISLNYCSQNEGNVYRAPYYNRNPNIGPRIIGNLDQYPCDS